MATAALREAHEAIQHFLADARQPVLTEPGVEPIPLVENRFEVIFEEHRLSVQAWTDDRNLFRRVTALKQAGQGSVDLEISRFGGKTGLLRLIDLGRPVAAKLTRRASRMNFAEQFRRFLERQYPTWRIADLSCEADLEHSLSPAYPRAYLRRGATGLAAIAAPPYGDVDGVLTFGLVWLDYLRRREKTITVEGLVLLVPARREKTTCHRIRQLDSTKAVYSVFAAAEGWEQAVDIDDAGNIHTELPPAGGHLAVPEWLTGVAQLAFVEAVTCSDAISLRVCGLEIVRCSETGVRFGLGGKRMATPRHASEIKSLAQEVAAARRPEGHTQNPLYMASPERWLESRVRSAIDQIDPRLQPQPVYTQAPSLAGTERGIIDLLAVTTDGRLTVVELKAEEDPHLPLQALEYQARVGWHLERGEFSSRGYFPDARIRRVPPRILLVAPALMFHSTTETILQFFPPHVEVERIGVAAGWRSDLRVVSRAAGL